MQQRLAGEMNVKKKEGEKKDLPHNNTQNVQEKNTCDETLCIRVTVGGAIWCDREAAECRKVSL